MMNIKDEFLIARLRLTFYYSLIAVVILGGSSMLLYRLILSNLSQSIFDSIPDPHIAQIITDRAQDILLNRFLTIDLILIIVIVILGFFLTHKTLEPIKSNMDKQKRFIADASHDLRTPIAVVISGLEVNLGNKNLDLVGAKKTLENTLEEMREFSKLSNDLLDISKYDISEQIKYEPIEIKELLKYIVEKNYKLAEIKNINIITNLNSEAIIKGNRIELSRVFFNILDNAIKYTPNGGKIFISDKIISSKYVVTVSDAGVGIKEDIMGKIFDPFFRGDEARSSGGAGLGLTLSKKIVENHKGTIVIKSEVNIGTNVTITLPISS